MTSLIILLIVGCAAIAVLLACLKGFRQASRYKKIEGAFLNVEKGSRRLSARRNSSLIGPLQRKPNPSREPAAHQVCSSTAALVEMAIILGSRHIYTDVPAGSRDPKESRLRHNGKAARQDRMNDPQPRVQPLNNS